MIRITIEGPQGSGKSRLAAVIAACARDLIQAEHGRAIVQLIDNEGPVINRQGVDVQILVRQTRPDPLGEALNSGDGTYRP